MTSTAAADWYQTLWDRFFGDGTGAGFEALPDNPTDTAALQRIIRAKAGVLWDIADGNAAPAAFLSWGNGFLDRAVKQGGRATVTANTRRDPRKPRYARIPSGVHTCPFCLMLASRGAVYSSAETAGGEGHDYHDRCHCEPAPEWGKGGLDRIEGYDPDLYMSVYRDARRALEHPGSMDPDLRAAVLDAAPSTVHVTQANGRVHAVTYDSGSANNLNALALVMRAQHPELFKD